MNRALSIRSKHRDGSSSRDSKQGTRHRFNMASLRSMHQPELSKKLYRLIKSENHAISAYENAAKEQASIASQLSDWGEETGDDAISDLSDKLGVLLAEIAEQEDALAQGLEDSRSSLKQIRNTESSVQPARDHKAKIEDEIQKLKYKEPTSVKIPTLEQELVRAEAQSLVAEAQLTNVTRQKFKESYDIHTAAIIERAEKQILLARNARKLLNLLDDTPIVPGEGHAPFDQVEAAREILNMAESDLRNWSPNVEPIHSSAGALGSNAMPASRVEQGYGAESPQAYSPQPEPAYTDTTTASTNLENAPIVTAEPPPHLTEHHHEAAPATATVEPPYPTHGETMPAESTY